MIHEDGSVRWVLEQAFPIDDEHGNPWLIQGVIFDITERKSAEEQVTWLMREWEQLSTALAAHE